MVIRKNVSSFRDLFIPALYGPLSIFKVADPIDRQIAFKDL
jgi:hypothetical protein